MEQAPVGTKLALIETAGELFAAHGFEGTSVRAIAEKTGANVASINYHFGSKENLYTEVMHYVVYRGRSVTPSVVAAADARLDTPEGAAEVIREIVRADFETFYAADQPPWYGRLITRSLLDPTPTLRAVVKRIFEPDHEALKVIFMRARPGMTAEDARFWAFALTAQVVFYEFCRGPVLLHLKWDQYDRSFLDAAANHIARSVIAALGLPQPESARPASHEDASTSEDAVVGAGVQK